MVIEHDRLFMSHFLMTCSMYVAYYCYFKTQNMDEALM